MPRSIALRPLLGVAILVSVAAPVLAQLQPSPFKNLKVLPQDITRPELQATMSGFTRALGVRCTYCHVGEEGKSVRPEDFPKDDKPTKEKARAMIRMVQDINDKYLAALATRSNPPVRVQCVTCHRGTPQPRMLQDVLKHAYSTGGIDSTVARYHNLRDRFYGRFTYDFGEVPLADVATALRDSGHIDDAAQLASLNLEVNPNSGLAKRQLSNVTISQAFRTAGIDSGLMAHREMKARYGASVVSEGLVNDVGYQLLAARKTDEAIALFEQNAKDYPQSGNVYDSLGEAYATKGDRKLAIAAYTKAAALDSTNTHAREKLDELRGKKKAK